MSTKPDFMPASTVRPMARLAALLSYAFRAVLAFGRALSHRSDVRTLLEMDDRALKDIGLTRADVQNALSEPLIKDPSKILLVRSVGRRARQRPLVIARTPSGVPAYPGR